jgi:hypothetical protein
LPPGLSPRDPGLVELAPAAGIDRESFDELIELSITPSPYCADLAWLPILRLSFTCCLRHFWQNSLPEMGVELSSILPEKRIIELKFCHI